MKNLTEKTKLMVAEETTLMDGLVALLTFKDIADMGDEELKLMASFIRLANLANEVVLEQARVIEEMNEKLDRILEQKD